MFRSGQERAKAEREQKPLLADPAPLLDQHPLHDRDLPSGAAETSARTPETRPVSQSPEVRHLSRSPQSVPAPDLARGHPATHTGPSRVQRPFIG